MSVTEILDQIADRLQESVQDGEASEMERDVYLIAIRRMCARCDGKPVDGDTRCTVTGALHPWMDADAWDESHPTRGETWETGPDDDFDQNRSQ